MATEEKLPANGEATTCPQCGTELVITRITPILLVGEFEHLTLVCNTCGYTKQLDVRHG